MNIDFDIVTPESIGLESCVISRAMRKLNENLVPMHSFLISRGRKLSFSSYYYPFDETKIHRLYSCTKSFVSLAIGILLKKKLIKLSDRIVLYFPEKCTLGVSEYLDQLTIENMLMMETCYTSTTYKKGGDANYIKSYVDDWVGSFFTTDPTHHSGDIFLYDTSSTHVLCALVEKLSGESLLDFLRSELFEKIGCTGSSDIVKDPVGVSVGGSGLMITSLDLMRVMRFVADGGHEIIDEEYIRKATSKQVENNITSGSFSLDTRSGYGYQFWMMRNSSYGMFGLGGQFAIYIPQKDLVFVTTADTQGYPGYDNLILDAVWSIASEVKNEPLKENKKAYDALMLEVSQFRLVSLENSEEIKKIKSRYFVKENKNKLKEILVDTTGEYGKLTLSFEEREYKIEFGYGENRIVTSPFENGGEIASSSSFFKNTISIVVKLLSYEFGSLNIELGLNGDGLTLYMKLIGELSITGFSGVYDASLE